MWQKRPISMVYSHCHFKHCRNITYHLHLISAEKKVKGFIDKHPEKAAMIAAGIGAAIGAAVTSALKKAGKKK